MKGLFIYYTLSDNGDLVAEAMKKKGYDVRSVKLLKPMPKKIFFQIMTGGFLAGIKNKAKLDGYDPDVSGYDVVTIGSPIWNGRITPAINAVLSETDLSGKKISFVLTSGGGSAPKAEARIKDEYPDASVVMLKEPKKYGDELSKLSAVPELDSNDEKEEK